MQVWGYKSEKKNEFKKYGNNYINCYIGYVRQELTMNKIHKDIEAKQTQLNELQDKNKKLQDEVNQSSTDEYIERMARERLGMIKNGEKVITNSDSPQDKQNNSEVKNNQNK